LGFQLLWWECLLVQEQQEEELLAANLMEQSELLLTDALGLQKTVSVGQQLKDRLGLN
jgi:hypothetical protein